MKNNFQKSIAIIITIALFTLPFRAHSAIVEISKDFQWEVLYFESNLPKKINQKILKISQDFRFKDIIRKIDNCDNVDYTKSNHSCVRIRAAGEETEISYRNLKTLQKNTLKSTDYLTISDHIYKLSVGGYSPLLNDFIISGQLKTGDQITHSIFISNIDGTKKKKIIDSKKSIVSISLNKNKETLAYISYEKIYPKIFLHNIKTQKRVFLSKIPGKINSLSWDLSGENLLISLKHEEDYYNIYKFNVLNGAFSKLTNFNFDVINPKEYLKNKIVYTGIKSGSPSSYASDLNERTTQELNIGKTSRYSSDITPSDSNTLVIGRDENDFTLLLLDNPYSKKHKTIYRNKSIESPKIFEKTKHFILTTDSIFGNTMKVIDFQGVTNKTLGFKEFKIIEMEII